MTTREVLTGGLNLFCASGGNASNDGLSWATPFRQPQEAIDRLYNHYDLGGMPVDIWLADGQTFEGVHLWGPFVGARGPNVTLRCGSGWGTGTRIKPKPGYYCVGLAYGATLQVTNMVGDKSDGSQDCIAVGQNSNLTLLGLNHLIQNDTGHGSNHMSVYQNANLDIVMNPGSNGILYLEGQAQCGMQVDMHSTLAAQCNFGHGLIAIWALRDMNGRLPHYTDAFADVAGASKINLGGVDFHETATGYKYRIREGGTLQLGLEIDPAQLGVMLGSADTNWPIQGYLV